MILPALSTRIPGGAVHASLRVTSRQFPESLAAWNAAFPTVAAPISLWPFGDEASPVVDTVGAIDLVKDTITSGSSTLFRQTGDPYGRYGVQLRSIAGHLRYPALAGLQQTTDSFSILFRFKATDAAGNGQYFARKGSTSAGQVFYGIHYNGTGGLRYRFDTPAAGESGATVTANHADGEWHDVLGVVDRANATLDLYTDLGSASTSIAAHAGGSVSNGSWFGFGDVNGNLNACARVMYTYGAFFDYALTLAQFNAIRAGG